MTVWELENCCTNWCERRHLADPGDFQMQNVSLENERVISHDPPRSETDRPPRIGFEDPLWLIPRALTKLNSVWVRATHPFVSLGKGVSIHYTCDLCNTGLMKIGDLLTVHKDVWLHAHCAPENQGEATLVIDDYCFIGRRSHISAKNLIHIERGVMLAASVLIQDHGHAFNDITMPIRDQGVAEGGKIRIGEGCWIGQGAAVICDSGELTLGRNCVVAANAVVTRSAPPYSILSGNPARIVKQFDPVKGTWVLGSSRPVETESTRSQGVPLASSAKAAAIATLDSEPKV